VDLAWNQMGFEEYDHLNAQLHGTGWRRASPGATAECYVSDHWATYQVTNVNDETREIRIDLNVPAGSGRRILDASYYRAVHESGRV
jgi:hypothetical protein